MKSAHLNLSDQINVEEFRRLNPQEQANIINTAFLVPLKESLDHILLEDSPIFLVAPKNVYNKL